MIQVKYNLATATYRVNCDRSELADEFDYNAHVQSNVFDLHIESQQARADFSRVAFQEISQAEVEKFSRSFNFVLSWTSCRMRSICTFIKFQNT